MKEKTAEEQAREEKNAEITKKIRAERGAKIGAGGNATENCASARERVENEMHKNTGE